MTMTKEYYRAQPMAANAVYNSASSHIAGFLATATGTITITDGDGTVLLLAMPLALGFTRIPIMMNTTFCTVTLAGGAAGSLLL